MLSQMDAIEALILFIPAIYKERGDNGLFITLAPKVLLWRFLIRWIHNFVEFSEFFIGWIIKLSVQTFQPLIVIYRR